MTHKRFFAKIVSTVLIIAVLASFGVVLFACNKDKTKSITDIFQNTSSAQEFSGYKHEFTLPVGWSVYTSSLTSSDSKNSASDVNSDVGYIPLADAFVVTDGSGNLSVVKCSDSRVYFDGGIAGMILPQSLGISALRVKDGLIVCKFANGEAGAFDMNGNTVISRTKIGSSDSKAIGTNIKIDSAIKILDSGLVAVNYLYDVSGASGYTSIYRPTTSGELSTRGEIVCRVANNDNKLDYVNGFDNRYVTVVGNEVGDCIYSIPQSANGNPSNMSGTANGTVVDTGKDDYYSEITYIGNGKFFIHEDWTVAETDEYTYYDGYDYYVFQRRIYQPDNDRSTNYTANSDKVFLYMSNNYYASDRIGVDTSSYLNDGYTYASYGLTIIDRVGFYDQFILDENLNVVMSLTGNYGVTIKDQKKEKVGYYDLIMQAVDGYFYIPLMPSQANIYDSNGNLVGQNTGHHILQQELSNNIVVAGIQDPDDEDEILYGAYNLYGKDVIEFKYLSLSAFRGSYTIGERITDGNQKTMQIIGSDGKVVEVMSDGSKPLADIATNSSGTAIYKIGCYMYRVDSGEKDSENKTIYYYGVKNFNPNVEKNVVMPATMRAGCVLYAPASSSKDVFVFEKISEGNSVTYAVYRLV